MKEMPGDIIILHKNRKLKNEKNHWEISSFYTCVPKIMIRWFTIPGIGCIMDRLIDGKSDI